MTKFKLLLKLKEGPQKCLRTIRAYLMDKPDKEGNFEGSDHGARRKIKVHKKGDEMRPREDLANTSSEEGFIPLAARDSKWVDLAFYNPNFQSQQDEEDFDEEEELQVVDVEGNLKAPMLILFPGLKENDESSSIIANNLGSTTDVTKMLVGQKPDFSRMRSSRKFQPTENRLSSVPEMPQEETESLDGSAISYLLAESIPDSEELDEVHESEDDGSVRATHTKRRKKRSIVKVVSYDSSSSMVNALRQRPPSKSRLKGNQVAKMKNELGLKSSSNGNLGDEDTS